MKKFLRYVEVLRETVIILLLISIISDAYFITIRGIFDIYLYLLVAVLSYGSWLIFIPRKSGKAVMVIYGIGLILLNFPRLMSDLYNINLILYLAIMILGICIMIFNCYIMTNFFQDDFPEFSRRWKILRFQKKNLNSRD